MTMHAGAILPCEGLDPTETVHDGMARAFEYLPVGVLVTDLAARILLRNRRADESLGGGTGIREQGGLLRCDFAEDSMALMRAFERLRRDEGTPPPALTPRAATACSTLELMLHRAAGGRTATVFISNPERPAKFNAALARQLYGLSEREVDVARAVVAGQTLVDIAAALRVEKETVRSHLKQIFAKTRTARQAELVRLLCTGLFGVGV